MPTIEAEGVRADSDERASYELAFHVLPTIVEGEVPAVFDAITKIVTDAGGELFDQEAPQRFDLAYEIVKYVEGKNRKFGSAYFGWVRFKADASAVDGIAHAVATRTDILRHLLIRLTREEEAHPFRFHEALASEKQVTNVGDDANAPKETPAEGGEVDEGALDEALNKEEAA